MMQRSSKVWESTLSSVLESLQNGQGVMLSAPTGSGRTYLLAAVAERLGAMGTQALHLDALSPSTTIAVSESGSDTILLLDSFEQARLPQVAAVGEHLRAGGTCLLAVDTSNRESSLNHAIRAFEILSSDVLSVWEQLTPLELQPLPAALIERLVHARSRLPLTSSTAGAIVALAEGRPRWALDLCELALAGSVASFPQPAVAIGRSNGVTPPGFKSAARTIGPLSAASAASAVVLALVDPIDFAGIQDLVGASQADLLLRNGLLFRLPDTDLFYVPHFLAAAVSEHAPAAIIDTHVRTLQLRLLSKAVLGFPLTDSETRMVTRTVSFEDEAESALFAPVRDELIQRLIVRLVSFGDNSLAQSLLMRTSPARIPVAPPTYAIAMSALVGPAAGLAALGEPESQADAAPEEMDSDAGLARGYLASLLRASADIPSSAGDHAAGEPQTGAVGSPNTTGSRRDDVSEVLRLWNSSGSLSDSLTYLRSIGAKYGADHVGVIASSLADIECVWAGHVPRESWLFGNGPVPHPAMHRSEELQQLSGAILLTHTLSALQSGQFAVRREELESLAAQTKHREYHARWLRHLTASNQALTCGDLGRATMEWSQVMQHYPRFIPRRLRACLVDIDVALQTAAEAPALGSGELTESSVLSAVHYLGGRHAQLPRHYPSAAGSPLATRLSVLQFKHLRASDSENPAELLLVADELFDLGLWAPAGYALAQARQIYLARRTVSGVQAVSERIERLETHLEGSVAWYSRGMLRASDYTRLTTREREAACLAAEGLSNKQIATLLHCSVRTVESHIAQARAKLGAATRKDLTKVAFLFQSPDSNQLWKA